MRIAITGSSGLIGSGLVPALRRDGHDVVRVVRSREAAGALDAVFWRPSDEQVDASRLEGIDAVIHLAAESLFGVWTPGKKRRIRESRVTGTRLMANTLAGLDRPPAVLLSASAVGYYGDRPPAETLDESAPKGAGFLADVVDAWEAAAGAAKQAGIRVVHMRTAPVLHPDGGMLGVMLPVFRLGLGGRLGDGRQPLPWITRRDVTGIARFLLQRQDLHGPVNLVAPGVVSNREFTRTLGRVLDRPTFLAVPQLALDLLGEMGREFSAGANVVPRKLDDAGYEWRDPELRPALERMLRRRQPAD